MVILIHCLRYLVIAVGCLRYLITGDCGCACGYATFYRYPSGERVRPFVPEADCPIHDNDKWWARLVRKRKHNPTWSEY